MKLHPVSRLVTVMLIALVERSRANSPTPARLQVELPAERGVYQRDERNQARLPVRCAGISGDGVRLELRVRDRVSSRTVLDWTPVLDGKSPPVPAGWHRVELRARTGGNITATGVVERVGIGEVFLTCGQSNSANHGNPAQKAGEDRVNSCDFRTGLWRQGSDPQPGATGNGGSPWALLGDLLANEHDVPVGFLCVGVGSTAVNAWAPDKPNYGRIQKALALAGPRGVRAVLWHQGESDSIAGTSAESYARGLTEIIERSRRDAGWDVPWGVARASYHPQTKNRPEVQAAVIEGQTRCIAGVPGVFAGPATDGFQARGMLADGVHFNSEGLAAHARGWAAALSTAGFMPRKSGAR